MVDCLPDQRASSNEDRISKAPNAPTTNRSITRFAARFNLPDVDERKPRRRRAMPGPETPRVKSEKELREDAAWKRVEETGKPVVLDDCLLLPNGMSVSEAIQFLPDDVRERTEEAWDAKLSQVYQILIDGAEEQIRKKVEEDGKLAWYNALPWAARASFIESVVRRQMGWPEVSFEELLERYDKPHDTVQAKRKKKAQYNEKRSMVAHPSVGTANRGADRDISEGASNSTPPTDDPNRTRVRGTTPARQPAARTSLVLSKTAISSAAAEGDITLQWNREHHRFLLKRLDQIWGYLDAEEQEAVQHLLKRKIGKEEIEQIDEIVKGVEWVRRLEK